MNAAQKMVEIAEKECLTHGIPTTKKRVKVLSILLKSKKAISAYELAEVYEQIFGEAVPVITVYRVLEFLQFNKLVHKLETANKFVICSHVSCGQDHSASHFLICKQCLKVKELSMSEEDLNELKQTVEKAGFYFNEPQLEMNCICKTCQSELA